MNDPDVSTDYQELYEKMEKSFRMTLDHVSQTEEEAAEAAPEEREDFAVPLIVVDAGHGGADRGCAAKNAEEADWDVVPEKDINLAIAQKAKAHLEAMGYRVRMVREGDQEIDTQERARLAEESGAAAYISIHQNVLEDCAVKGIEVHYNGTDDSEGRRFAQLLQQQMAKKTEATELAVLEEPDLPTANGKVRLACMVKTGCLTNEEERGKLATEEYQEQVAEGIAQGVDYYFHPKTMYLTFDDGPTEENTSRVLDILKKRGIKATFFVVGHFLESAPDIVRRMVADGHTVGNHTYHHPDMSKISDKKSFQKEMEDVAALFKEVTGEELAMYYRPPQGKYSTENLKMAKELGYSTFFWSLAYVDWSQEDQPTHEEAFEKLMGRIHPGAVVLLHSTSKTNGEIMDELLTKWEEMGYSFKPLSDLVEGGSGKGALGGGTGNGEGAQGSGTGNGEGA